MQLSACWIVKNEAGNIAASIQSVKDCADELIVVDTGSTDGTARAARDCGAKVKEFAWRSDFSAARNHALALAKGEYVMFIDADEYFDPPLSATDAERFVKLFVNGADVLQFRRIEVERASGKCTGLTLVNRVLRRETVEYVGRIHESPLRKDGESVAVASVDGCNLFHTGYSSGVRAEKERRNVQILEEERQMLGDPFKLFHNAAYLMREYHSLENLEKAAEYCRYLIEHSEHFAYACEVFGTAYLPQIYYAIRIAEKRRDMFSAKEICATLFRALKENYPGTRDAALADLHFELCFDYQQDRFIRGVTEIEPLLDALPPTEVLDCRAVEGEIFTRAAEAMQERGDADRTFRWAMHAMRHARISDSRPLKLLLGCMRSSEPREIALFLRNLLDLSRPDVAAGVAALLSAEGYHDVYRLLL